MHRVALGLLLSLVTLAAPETAGIWRSMFDGKTLRGWRETPFKGKGEVKVANGAITLGPGAPMTGITWTEDLPRIDYEVRFEAARLSGGDFFASLTFPVQDSYATFVAGGWGGDIVGVSSIDGWDASDNETRTYFTFEPGKWYRFLIRIRADRITASIDGQDVVNVGIEGRTIGLRRGDIKLSAPFGFASYNTTGGVRKIEIRSLTAGQR